MSGYHDNSNSRINLPEDNEDLEQIPEDTELSGLLYSPNSRSTDTPTTLGSETVVRWFEHNGSEEPNDELKSTPKAKSHKPPNANQVKHRRTRSGCYTCRTRRVKCDEARPICERCRKGSRECTWPPEGTGKSSGSSKTAKHVDHETDSSGMDDEESDRTPREDRSNRETIPRRSGHSSLPSISTSGKRHNRATTAGKQSFSQSQEKSASPSTTEDTRADSDFLSPLAYQSNASTNTSHDDISWSRLTQEQQFYLNYHRTSLSHCYYFLKMDPCHFISTTLIDSALTYEPLLNAVVGFSAFHYALNNPGQKISSFLIYYNKGVSLLRQDLFRGKAPTDAMLYTILQLATFEEYLGDWANLMFHLKAACEILKNLYTTETMMLTNKSRTLFDWYIRFDVFVAFMAESEVLIGIEWSQAYYDKVQALSLQDPSNIGRRLEWLHAEGRIIGMNIGILFTKLRKGEIGIQEFSEKDRELLQSIDNWAANIQDLRLYSNHLVSEFANERSPTSQDVHNPFEPGTIFDEQMFAANFMILDCITMEIMHKMQTAAVLRQAPPANLTDLALRQGPVIDAIKEYEGSPPGAFMPVQVNVVLICLLAPRDDKHISWCLNWLLRYENSGYIYPPSVRSKIADSWSMPELKTSWLSDKSQKTPIIRDLLQFVEERTTKPQTRLSEDIRSMKAVLETLSLDSSPKDSPESSSSPSELYNNRHQSGGSNQPRSR